ncbi:hypothetical protein BsIDN1_39530 [Bacillus safensis]|uniref:chorismate mutase n=1 Tax=Bacillus safensis TaxID=561879 RepID=A0A5S9MBU8_BACIA|nr:hypothetical protein BsIDN1_39530 [Bacillus safensis]
MQELDIDGGLKQCIRVLMTVQTDTKQEDIQHVYLEEAVTLRPDLQLTKKQGIIIRYEQPKFTHRCKRHCKLREDEK